MVTFAPLAFLLLQLSYVFAGSQGRYNHVSLRSNLVERNKRMHAVDCSFNICEHVPNYPEAEVSKLIKRHSALHSYFGGKIIQPSKVMSLGTRDNDEGPTPFCETKDVSVVPRQMLDIDGATRFIANVEGFSQVVSYQVCRNDNGEQCYLGNTLGFKTSCLQKFNDIKLVTVKNPDHEDNELEFRTFSVPSTCVCTYTKTESFK